MAEKPCDYQNRRGGFAAWHDPHSDGQYEVAFFRSTDRFGSSSVDRRYRLARHAKAIQRAEKKAGNGHQLRAIRGSDCLLARSRVYLHQLQRIADNG